MIEDKDTVESPLAESVLSVTSEDAEEEGVCSWVRPSLEDVQEEEEQELGGEGLGGEGFFVSFVEEQEEVTGGDEPDSATPGEEGGDVRDWPFFSEE